MRPGLGWLTPVLLLAACTGDGTSAVEEIPPTSSTVDVTAGSTSPDLPSLPEETTAEQPPTSLTCWTAPAGGPTGPIQFSEATAEFGLVEPLVGLHVHAGAFGDVNEDDVPDLVVGTFGDRPAEAYRWRGADGPNPDQLLIGSSRLEPVPGWSEELGRTSAAVFADLDGDGDDDLLLIRHAGLARQSGIPSRIFENADGTLLPKAEPLPPGFLGRTAAVADFDDDGLLDLYVSEDRYGDHGGLLLRNMGSFQFSDVTLGSGLEGTSSLGATAADLNRDGRLDLVTSRRVFLNQGGLQFSDVTPSGYEMKPITADDDPGGVAVGDLNKDSWPDIVLGHHFRSTVERDTQVAIRVFLSSSSGQRFEDVTEAVGVPPFPTLAPHVQIADVDNDSWLDIVTSASASDGTRPAVLRNQGGSELRFDTVSGLGSDQYWVGGPVVDLDRDGRLDMLALEWEPSLPSLFFRNTGSTGHWLEISMSGSGRGIGSIVEVSGADGELLGWAEIGVGGGYASGRMPIAHLGLGDQTTVNVHVTHADGTITVLDAVSADQHLRLPNGC